MQRPLIVAALALLVALAAPASSPASCPKSVQPFGAWFEQADVVFVGRAIEVKDVPVGPPPGMPPGGYVEHTARFHVDELFKGDAGEEVTVLAEKPWDDCIVKFDQGEQYVVFAFHRGPTGGGTEKALRSDDSSPTARVAARSDAVAYLRYRAANGREPSLVGTVYDRTPTSLEGLYGQTHIGWYGVTTRSGIPVSLTAGDRKLETVSDANGAFVFGDVPAGTYSIRIELPDGHRLLEQHERLPFMLRARGEAPDRVTIEPGETSARYFTVTGAASVVGRALAPSGEPIGGRYVHLVLASAIESFRPNEGNDNLRADVATSGAFELDVVPPGEYVLVVSPGYTAAFDRNGPTFYYPNVTDPAKATRLRISEGKRLDLGDLKAPANTAYRPVDVAVVDAAGRGRQTGLHCIPVEPAGDGHFFLTDEAGRARLYLPPGVRYRIEVGPGWDVRQVDAPVEVGAGPSLAPVKLLVVDAPPEEDDEPEEP